MIDFGIGQPQIELLPNELLRKANEALLSRADNSYLNYGHPQGDPTMRHALAEFLLPFYGKAVDPKLLLATNGSSHALHLISQVFAQPGDTVLVEEPTYFLAHQIFRDRGLKIVGVPLGKDGVEPSAFEEALKKHKPTFFYTIPIFQNPSGRSMSPIAKANLVASASAHDCLVVADEVYQCLSYQGATAPPMSNWLDSEHVLSVGSFSKILAPGLRLGWIETSPNLLAKLLEFGVLKSGGGFNPYVGALVGHILERGWQQEYLNKIRSVLATRLELMDCLLESELGDLVDYEKPTGGYFFWVRLKDGRDAEQLSEYAARHKTGFRSGHRFSTLGGFQSYLRLSFAHYDEAAIRQGIQRLEMALR